MVACPENIDERLAVARPLLGQGDPRLTEAEIVDRLGWTKGQVSALRTQRRYAWDKLRGPGGQAGRIRHRSTRLQQ